jgi:hypothetical protein
VTVLELVEGLELSCEGRFRICNYITEKEEIDEIFLTLWCDKTTY